MLLAFLGLFLLGVAVLSTVILSSKKGQEKSVEILPAENSQPEEILVHVAGAVQKPGLYRLKQGARVNDALIAAGGLSVKADREWFETSINLAQPLNDGVKIYIPAKGEGKVAGQKTAAPANTFPRKININTASLDQLQSLPKIGPVSAQKIIDSRPFSQIEDILKVPGIGEKTFNILKDKITVF